MRAIRRLMASRSVISVSARSRPQWIAWGSSGLGDARRIVCYRVLIGCAAAALLGAAVYALREAVLRIYTNDPAVAAAALPLLAWIALV
jgi:Na+-driven multidrug efflux pump